MSIAQNIQEIRKNIPANVSLVCVSKFHPENAILEAYNCGERIFGESRVQELLVERRILAHQHRIEGGQRLGPGRDLAIPRAGMAVQADAGQLDLDEAAGDPPALETDPALLGIGQAATASGGGGHHDDGRVLVDLEIVDRIDDEGQMRRGHAFEFP